MITQSIDIVTSNIIEGTEIIDYCHGCYNNYKFVETFITLYYLVCLFKMYLSYKYSLNLGTKSLCETVSINEERSKFMESDLHIHKKLSAGSH